MIVVLLTALVLRLLNIDQSFWLDESIGAIYGSKYSFGQLVFEFTKYDFHPPLYYLILKVWGAIFGFSEVAVRMLSVSFGVATVGVVYRLAQKLNLNATVAALLLATSPLHIYYSQEARMYPLVTFFVTLSIYSYFELTHKITKNYLILFAISLVAFMGLDYLPVLVLPVFFLVSYTAKLKINFYKNLVIAFLPLGVIALFWAPVFMTQIEGARNLSSDLPLWKGIVGTPSFKEVALVWIKFTLGRLTFYDKTFYAIVIGAVSIPFAFAFIKGIFSRKWILVFWFFVPLVLGFVASFIVPAFTYFRFLYVLPAFYLIIAMGVQRSTLFATILIFINMVCLGLFSMNTHLHRENWREAVRYVESESQGDEIAVFSFSAPVAPFVWYESKKIESVGNKVGKEELISKKQDIWYFEYLADVTDPDRTLLSSLYASGYTIVKEASFPGVGKVVRLEIKQ